MNFTDWYTDGLEIWRNTPTLVGSLTKMVRSKVYKGLYCRVYQNPHGSPQMNQTAADDRSDMRIACDLSVDLQHGDEVIITRGARVGGTQTLKGFVGDIRYYREPYGAVMPGLAHQEADLLMQERL